MRYDTKSASVVVLLVALAATARAADDTIYGGPLGREIDEAVQRSTGGGFWGAVLVAREGEILLAKGYGFADYASTPNTPRTLFEIASASKQFTAAAILRLEQQGRLKTSDPLSRFFPKAPKDKRTITVHQLLTHTSGISPRVGVPYASPLTRDAWLDVVLAPPLDSAPGEKFAYCNVGYALLAAIVEVASKRSFEEYMTKEVFGRAGLEETGLIRDRKLLKSKRASARLSDEGDRFTAVDWYWGWGYRGMGGVVTTALDLLAWDRALRGDEVLGAAAKEKLHTPALAGYACGWLVETTPRGTRKAHHGGGVRGYGCYLVRFLEDDALIVVLSNGRTDPRAVATTIEERLFPSPKIEAVVDATPYELGRYRNVEVKGDLSWTVRRDGERVAVRLRDGKHETLSIDLPPGAAKKLVEEISRAIAVRKRDDPGGAAAIEAGLYLLTWPDSKRVVLTEGVSVEIRPYYTGRDEAGNQVVDRRTILILADGPRGLWASIVKMNVAAASALLAGLEKAAD